MIASLAVWPRADWHADLSLPGVLRPATEACPAPRFWHVRGGRPPPLPSCPNARPAGSGTAAMIARYRLLPVVMHMLAVSSWMPRGCERCPCQQSATSSAGLGAIDAPERPSTPTRRTPVVSWRSCIPIFLRQPPAADRAAARTQELHQLLLMLLRPGVQWCVQGTTAWVRCARAMPMYGIEHELAW